MSGWPRMWVRLSTSVVLRIRSRAQWLTAKHLGQSAHHDRDGRIQETNFDTYPLLRMPKAPRVHVQMMASGYSPTGAGSPLPPLAPAVGNAVFAACGERIRELPFSKAGFRSKPMNSCDDYKKGPH
ncbi:MAG: hypothetical protein CM15mP89_2890 [Gammaproteobacteria bacterium]|nr:MAG: hypothetical protein CM15mP89_2890 [Gammaproteobacteria bacterium]